MKDTIYRAANLPAPGTPVFVGDTPIGVVVNLDDGTRGVLAQGAYTTAEAVYPAEGVRDYTGEPVREGTWAELVGWRDQQVEAMRAELTRDPPPKHGDGSYIRGLPEYGVAVAEPATPGDVQLDDRDLVITIDPSCESWCTLGVAGPVEVLVFLTSGEIRVHGETVTTDAALVSRLRMSLFDTRGPVVVRHFGDDLYVYHRDEVLRLDRAGATLGGNPIIAAEVVAWFRRVLSIPSSVPPTR